MAPGGGKNVLPDQYQRQFSPNYMTIDDSQKHNLGGSLSMQKNSDTKNSHRPKVYTEQQLDNYLQQL